LSSIALNWSPDESAEEGRYKIPKKEIKEEVKNGEKYNEEGDSCGGVCDNGGDGIVSWRAANVWNDRCVFAVIMLVAVGLLAQQA